MLITRSVSNERHAALPCLAWRKSRQRMMEAFVVGEPVPLISCLSRGLNWTERRLPSSLTNRTETMLLPALAMNWRMKEVLSMGRSRGGIAAHERRIPANGTRKGPRGPGFTICNNKIQGKVICGISPIHAHFPSVCNPTEEQMRAASFSLAGHNPPLKKGPLY